MTLGEIVRLLDQLAPFERAPDWDPVGLQLGDPDEEIATIAVCHELTEAVVAALGADPVDLVVTYHPLIFRPTRRLVAGPTADGRALRLVRSGSALCVMHTNWDVASGGAADALAAALDLEHAVPFAPLDPGEGLGVATAVASEGFLGRVGALPGAPSLETLARRVELALGPAPLRIAGDAGGAVRRLAVLPGAGEDFLAAARAAGADAVLTGDVRHHAARAARDLGLAILDPGHAATERPGVRALCALVAGLGLPLRDLGELDPCPWTRSG